MRLHYYVSTDHKITQGRLSWVKQQIKNLGGSGVTEHIDRDGSCFETSEIKLAGNNSKFKYNQHL